MAGPEFFETAMGRRFYEATAPRIARALDAIAGALGGDAQAGDAERRCASCAFWQSRQPHDPRTPLGAGGCHRRAPVVGEGGLTAWPQTIGEAWCGEWRLRDRGGA